MPSSICNIINLSRFSSYLHLLASSVYVYGFCFCSGVKGILTTSEFKELETEWIRAVQQKLFPRILDHLSYVSSRHNANRANAPPIIC